METVLIIATLVEVVIVIAVLAVYLIVIARTLRSIARTLGRVTFGVRAIEKQTEPIGPALDELNRSLEAAADELEGAPGKPTTA